MQIAVTTPTGHVGSRVVQLLVQAGVRPTVLVRDPARLDPDLRALVDVCTGDLGDAGYVQAATAGVDALYWVDPTDFTAPDPNAVTAEMGANAVNAIRANGIGRVVLQSTVGAEKRHGAGLLDGLAAVEEQFDATHAHITHLRCGYFFTNLLGALTTLRHGQLTTTMNADTPMPWVAPRDIAEVAAARLLAGDWTGRVVQGVHGPANLSYRRVAQILSDVLGCSIELTVRSDDAVRAELVDNGMSTVAADGIVGMTSGLRDGFVPEQSRSFVTTTPTTLAEWAYANLRPALAEPLVPAG